MRVHFGLYVGAAISILPEHTVSTGRRVSRALLSGMPVASCRLVDFVQLKPAVMDEIDHMTRRLKAMTKNCPLKPVLRAACFWNAALLRRKMGGKDVYCSAYR